MKLRTIEKDEELKQKKNKPQIKKVFSSKKLIPPIASPSKAKLLKAPTTNFANVTPQIKSKTKGSSKLTKRPSFTFQPPYNVKKEHKEIIEDVEEEEKVNDKVLIKPEQKVSLPIKNNPLLNKWEISVKDKLKKKS